MTKVTLNNVGSLVDYTTAGTTINNNFDTIETASDNTLSRDGTSPNTMESNFDMNSFQILNLPTPATANSPLRLQDLADFTGSGTVSNIPSGGTTGQLLGKTSNTDFATGWRDVSTGLTAGTNMAVTGTTPATIATIASPTFTTVNATTVNGTTVNSSSLTASSAVATDGSKNLVSVTNTGTGSNVLATSPSLVTPLLGTPTSGVLTNCTGLPVSTGIAGLAAGVGTFLATPSSANLITAVTDETGTGALTFATSPSLVTPLLGTPTSGTLTNCTGLPISSGVSGLAANVATFLATPSSANLISAMTDETGTGANVFATSPSLVTPLLGTPTSGTLTSCTGLPISTGVSGLGANVATFLATPSSANLISAVTDETGTGALVFGTSPAITTPNIIGVTNAGSASAGSYGEVMSAALAAGSAISLTTNTPANPTGVTITLTAGDWDVDAFVQFTTAATTNITQYIGSIGQTNGTTLDTTTAFAYGLYCTSGNVNGGAGHTVFMGPLRINVSGSQQLWLVARAQFTVSTLTAHGAIRARRVR